MSAISSLMEPPIRMTREETEGCRVFSNSGAKVKNKKRGKGRASSDCSSIKGPRFCMLLRGERRRKRAGKI